MSKAQLFDNSLGGIVMYWKKCFDLVIQLGSQVKFVDGQYQLPPHTRMRTAASAKVVQLGLTSRLIITGGSNFGVRYDDTTILKPANFSFDAFANSDFTRKSEAAVIKEFLIGEFGLRSEQILAEGLSATTTENAEIVKILLNRRPAFTGTEKIAILTQLYHMATALPAWHGVGLRNVEPLFVENVLTEEEPANIGRIMEYYSTPKGGKQYDTIKLLRLLSTGESLVEMLTA